MAQPEPFLWKLCDKFGIKVKEALHCTFPSITLRYNCCLYKMGVKITFDVVKTETIKWENILRIVLKKYIVTSACGFSDHIFN